VTLLLGALEMLLRDGGVRLVPGAGLEAAAASYAGSPVGRQATRQATHEV